MSNQYPEQLNSPSVESSIRQWHEFDGLHRLVGTKCLNCGKLFFPKRHVCIECHSQNVIPYRFKGRGVIRSFDFQFLPAVKVMGFREHAQRAMIVVTLDEGPSVVGELVDFRKKEDVKVNDPVEMVIRKITRSGNTDFKYAYKFILL